MSFLLLLHALQFGLVEFISTRKRHKVEAKYLQQGSVFDKKTNSFVKLLQVRVQLVVASDFYDKFSFQFLNVCWGFSVECCVGVGEAGTHQISNRPHQNLVAISGPTEFRVSGGHLALLSPASPSFSALLFPSVLLPILF